LPWRAGAPCDPAGRFFLPRISGMSLERMVESSPVNVLSMRRQVA
jgi:hypothetical protein